MWFFAFAPAFACNRILDWDAHPPAVCGNGILEEGETCENALMASLTCESLGYASGETECRQCQLDKNGCYTCGNGRAEPAETCDGSDLRGKTCGSLGYYDGELACWGNCSYDLSDCQHYGKCGDGILQPEQGELCDEWEFGSLSCADFDFWSGQLFCSEFCRILDTAGCRRVSGIATGGAHACLMDEGSVPWCWGDNTRQQVGVAGMLSVSSPQPLGILDCFSPPVPLSGFDTTCFFCAPRQTLWCFGDNRYGQLGLSDTFNRSSPVSISAPASPWTDMAIGAAHLCGVDRDGRAACAGDNTAGQLGDGTNESRTHFAFVQPPETAFFVQAAAGSDFTCALDDSGHAWCWGANDFGQLGTGHSGANPVPARVDHESPFHAITAGNFHACALDVSGNAWCWGRNENGQLGIGQLVSQNAPAAVHMPPGAVFGEVRCGGNSCCGVDSRKRVWCWGANGSGQLGIGPGPDRSEPQPVLLSGEESFANVAVGGSFACAVSTRSHVFCWGANDRGQLGDGTRISSAYPVRVVP